MDSIDYQFEYVYPSMEYKRGIIRAFLRAEGLQFEESIDFTLIITMNDTIIGTGSLDGYVLKCIAINRDYEGLNLAAKIVSELMSYGVRSGISHFFLFTKPETSNKFVELGFTEIACSANDAVLMDSRQNGVYEYLDSLGYTSADTKSAGAIVANCNPFTFGHLHLIEYAAQRCDILHVFVIAENKSMFSAGDRLQLVREGTAHISNVLIHEAKDYIISAATFPTYFLKKNSDVARIHARLDLNIFGKYIAPYFHIVKRFAGEEPMDMLTATYNEEMSKILPSYGVEFYTIPRLSMDGNAISASRVRTLLDTKNFNEIKKIVPSTTYEYLLHKGA